MTITRERPPFEGRSLAVISSIRRGGVLFLLVSLPDGSRSLVPAQWTDWRKGDAGDVRALPDDDTALRSLGSLADLLGLRHLVDALRSRSIGSVPQTESRHATDPGLSRPARSTSGRSSASIAPTLREQLDEAARGAALEILARLIARMLVAAANGASHE